MSIGCHQLSSGSLCRQTQRQRVINSIDRRENGRLDFQNKCIQSFTRANDGSMIHKANHVQYVFLVLHFIICTNDMLRLCNLNGKEVERKYQLY